MPDALKQGSAPERVLVLRLVWPKEQFAEFVRYASDALNNRFA